MYGRQEEEEFSVITSLFVHKRQGVYVYKPFQSILDKQGPLNSLEAQCKLEDSLIPY